MVRYSDNFALPNVGYVFPKFGRILLFPIDFHGKCDSSTNPLCNAESAIHVYFYMVDNRTILLRYVEESFFKISAVQDKNLSMKG